MALVAGDLGKLVLAIGAPLSLRKGDALFNEGDPSNSVYACRSGRLKVSVSTPGGEELVLGWKEAGEGFGELSALDGGPRSARITAVVDAELAVLSRAEFLEALRRAPDMAVGVLVELSAHLRRANARVTARRSERIPVRVAQRLVELAVQVRRHGEADGADGTIELQITQEDLAGWIGATRESTARALADLRRRELIETRRGRILVLDAAGLESAVVDVAGG
ncbi:MAG: Crp/Fnr family transcriptional regulator [Ilumatobacteraceae bacterium]